MMAKLFHRSGRLVWIDHHKTAIADYEKWKKLTGHTINGIRGTQRAACYYTWKWFSDKDVPLFVAYLSDYDSWTFDYEDSLAFQYAMRVEEWEPSGNPTLWETLFNRIDDKNFQKEFVSSKVKAGYNILDYVNSVNHRYVMSFGFSTTILGHRCFAVNKGQTNSKLFDSIPKGEYQVYCSFVLMKDKWLCSLFSADGVTDVSEIAKKFGGGGHRGAAGFMCDRLPFSGGTNAKV